MIEEYDGKMNENEVIPLHEFQSIFKKDEES